MSQTELMQKSFTTFNSRKEILLAKEILQKMVDEIDLRNMSCLKLNKSLWYISREHYKSCNFLEI